MDRQRPAESDDLELHLQMDDHDSHGIRDTHSLVYFFRLLWWDCGPHAPIWDRPGSRDSRIVIVRPGVRDWASVLGKLATFLCRWRRLVANFPQAPLSELYGRRNIHFITFACFTFFNAGVAGSQNIWTVIILRFFAGCFGSSPLTNAGGIIADCFPARERGLAMSVFSTAPFLGPTLGPIIGGFLGQSAGWRWLMGFMAAFSGFLWIVSFVLVPETYAPVLLRKRAETLSKKTGEVYRSKLDIERGTVSVGEAFMTALSRPWILLFWEPIVLILSVYMAIVYGTLYMMFAAFPIVFQEGRGWGEGIGGLTFLGILVGMLFAVAYNIFDNKRYQKTSDEHGGFAPPEARLSAAMVGGAALPIGLFWFAWTSYPTLPWQASVAACIPFGFGMVLVFLSIVVSLD